MSDATIQANDARMTVIGKSWPDVPSNSGSGEWEQIPQMDLPAKIVITTPPAKTQYVNMEMIDFAGIVVTAYKSDGTVWTNENYPNGVVPFEEITPSIRFALVDLSDSESFMYKFRNRPSGVYDRVIVNKPPVKGVTAYIHPPMYPNDIVIDVYGLSETYVVSYGERGILTAKISTDSEIYIPEMLAYGWYHVIASSEPHYLYAHTRLFTTDPHSPLPPEEWESRTFPWSYTGSLGTVYYDTLPYSSAMFFGTQGTAVMKESPSFNYSDHDIAYKMVYGDKDKNQPIELSWARPIDGQVLKTSFYIYITNGES